MREAIKVPGGVVVQYEFPVEALKVIPFPMVSTREMEWMTSNLRHLARKRATAAERERLADAWRWLISLKRWCPGIRLDGVWDGQRERKPRRWSFGPRKPDVRLPDDWDDDE